MAHEMERFDHAVFGDNKAAWHGLGTVVEGNPTSAEAIRIAQLDWPVHKEPLYVEGAEGGRMAVPNWCATVRGDLPKDEPLRVLGCVTKRYEVIQNAHAFSILDELSGEGGARIETAGSIRNGKIVYMTAILPEVTRVVDDTVCRYLLLTTAHDGTRSVQVLFTPVRVVCSNTLHWALGLSKNRASIVHTGNTRVKIEEAKRVLG